jgi:hypothetical protein
VATNSGTGTNANQADGQGKPPATVKATTAEIPNIIKPEPFLKGWTEPKAMILLSGEQHGYLEPCGCSLTQSGGVSRRADMIKQIKAKGWPVTALDLGGIIKRSRRQDKIKFETIRQALTMLGYKLVALGLEDLALDTDFLFSQVPDSTSPDTALPYLSSNVFFYGAEDLPSPAHYKIVKVGNVKLGVTAIYGMDYVKEQYGNGGPPGDQIAFGNPAESLKKVLVPMMAEKPDLLILLSHAPKAETQKILAEVPQFDIALTAGGREDPHISTQPEKIGKTQMWETGFKGKKVGMVGYYPDQPAGQQLKFELVDLDMERFQRTKEMEDLMRFYQDRLKNEQIIENEKAVPHPDNTGFMGAKSCGDCHTNAYKKWRSSKHAKAYESLEKGRKDYAAGEWISRVYDPECICCHTTGWHPQEVFRFETGFLSHKATPHLEGQQCENCHGPGQKHDELERAWRKDRQKSPDLQAERQKMHLDVATAEVKVCIRCHDPDNSPGFNFKKYWEEVKHPFKD